MESVNLIRETMGQRLTENARMFPNETAFLFDGLACTWHEADMISDGIALSMMKSGIERETIVGFWSMNTLQLVLYLIAAMKIGAVPAVINYSYRRFELENVLNKTRMERLYLGEQKRGSDYMAMISDVGDACPALRRIERMEATQGELKRRWNLPLCGEDSKALSARKNRVSADDTACIAFTSGTTSVPKAAMLTHFNILSNARQFAARMRVSHEAGDILCASLPLFHCSGLTGMLAFSLVAGMPVIIHRAFRAEDVMRDIDRYRATVLMVVPSMLELMVNHPNRNRYDLSSLRIGQTSGAGMTPERIYSVLTDLGFKRYIMAYGQTECSPLITATLYEDGWDKITGTVGKPLAHEEVRIWDLKRDCEQVPGEPGEIRVRGVNTMKGYFDSPEDTAAKFTDDGWLKTADVGYFDEDGYLHFVTRIADIIIRHGENISPAEIETVVERFDPAIRQVKVVGVPEQIVGEEVACLLTSDSQIDVKALHGYIGRMLASYKVPKYIYQVDALDMTATGKIDITAARKRALALKTKEEP